MALNITDIGAYLGDERESLLAHVPDDLQGATAPAGPGFCRSRQIERSTDTGFCAARRRSITDGWAGPAICRSCPDQASNIRREPRSHRTRFTSTRRLSSSWLSRVAAMGWRPRWAFSAQ